MSVMCGKKIAVIASRIVSALFVLLVLLLCPSRCVFPEEGAHSDYKRKAEFLVQEKDYTRALQYIQVYLKANPDDYMAQQIAARCYFELHLLDKAEKAAQKALELYKGDSVSAYYLGEIYLSRNKPDRSLYYFNRSIELNPEYPYAHIGAGRAWLRKKNQARAKREFTIAKEKSLIPDIPIYKAIAESFLQAGMPNDAILTYKALIDEYPETAELYYLTGRAYQKKGLEPQARGFFKQALDYDPHKAIYHEALGDSYAQSKKIGEAIKEYEKAAALGTVAPMTNYRLGLWYFKNEDSKRALAYLQKAVKGKHDLINAHMAISSIYLGSGDYKKCVQQCNLILRMQARNDTAYYNRACAYAMLGDRKNALESLKCAIQILPSNKDMAKDENYFKSIKGTDEFKKLTK